LKEGYVKGLVNKLKIRGARPIFLSDRISRGWPRNLSRDKELSGYRKKLNDQWSVDMRVK
jgi:hypothetical protein